ncbi:hypothetical protein PoB_002216500 [Plakobranchus ocellatus]|uniref:Uncharacterized protein n=1 Tax=Plakobranchus ocellatus TaxID=259542 RepID=A0AAV3ZJ38_9GAST|nr:hypothetical protein PoB_002216500 [Plakobranchus ocellatus]
MSGPAVSSRPPVRKSSQRKGVWPWALCDDVVVAGDAAGTRRCPAAGLQSVGGERLPLCHSGNELRLSEDGAKAKSGGNRHKLTGWRAGELTAAANLAA